MCRQINGSTSKSTWSFPPWITGTQTTMPDQCQIWTELLCYSLAISSSNQEKYHLEEGGLSRSQVTEIYVRKTDNSRIPEVSTICIWTLGRQMRRMSETMKRSSKSEMHNKENNTQEKEEADFQKQRRNECGRR